MEKSFRFLLRFAWVNLGCLFGFAALVVAGCYLTGVPGNAEADNLFETYYAMFPAMILMILFFFAFTLCTTQLNLAVSFGARRAGFFRGLQGMMAFYAAACWALQLFLSALPRLAGWADRGRWVLLSLFGGRVWVFPLLCFVLMVLGCLSGMVLAKSKPLGVLLMVLSVFVMIGVTVFMLISADRELMAGLLESEWGWLWAALPGAGLGALAAGAAGGELVIWRFIRRYTVR